MDFSKALFTGTGCDADGQIAANPMTQAVNQLLTGPEAFHMTGAYYDDRYQDVMEDAWEMTALRQPIPDLQAEWEASDQFSLEEVWKTQEYIQQPSDSNDWADEVVASNPDQIIKEKSGNIIRSLASYQNPKLKQSQFLKFLVSLHSGETTIVDNTLIKTESATTHQANLEALWTDSNADANYEKDQYLAVYEEVWRESEAEVAEEGTWAALSEDDKQMLQQAWVNDTDDISSEWQKLRPLNEYKESQLRVTELNPYLGNKDLFTFALEKIAESQISDAILGLEAEVTQNPNSSEAWNLLGRLHAENDEDVKAIGAFRRGYEADPFNSDSLLNLGISLLNEGQTDEALQLISDWVQGHSSYNGETIAPSIPVLIAALESAVHSHFTDADLQTVLGILHFITGNSDPAIICLSRASLLRPGDHTILNRVSAAMISAGLYTKSIENLYKALEIRPAFVRAWVNLGLAFFNTQNYAYAARNYLCALSLNPEATHLWNKVASCFKLLGNYHKDREDLIQKISLKNPMVYSDEFDIVTTEHLQRISYTPNH